MEPIELPVSGFQGKYKKPLFFVEGSTEASSTLSYNYQEELRYNQKKQNISTSFTELIDENFNQKRKSLPILLLKDKQGRLYIADPEGFQTHILPDYIMTARHARDFITTSIRLIEYGKRIGGTDKAKEIKNAYDNFLSTLEQED